MSRKRLGRYELLSVLGEGGMGTVYDAVLTGPGGFRKPVALKVLKEGGAGLVREAKLGGLLRHPNLVEVYALEQIDEIWVCAMERMPGGTLRRSDPLPPRALVEVGVQVCAGLTHAHRQVGLVHRDLKPSNLLLDGDVVKISDFGIARARGFGGDGKIRGTPAYMSPEQARGDRVDVRSDLWSLGVCLYELASGMRPTMHTGPGLTWSTVDLDALDERPVEVALPIHEVPWLAPVLARCLAPEPDDRYPNAAALSEALAALDAGGKGLADALGIQAPIVGGRRSTGASTSFTLTRPEHSRSNLVAEVDAFVGRLDDLDALDKLLATHNQVTLKGMGGTGKTRLARQFADRWSRRTQGQTWFVDLSAARSAADLLRAVAEVLSVPLGGGGPRSLSEQLGHALQGRGDVLLILDNFEQIVGEARLVETWAVDGVRLLVTSREPLHLDDEVLHEVQPLDVPEAVELLVRRAADRGRDIADHPALAELARRLDGLPLALELAAGRLAVLTPDQVLKRLDKRMKLLGGGVRGGRQATLRATLEWSWDLLDPNERSALAQLSVFHGGFGLQTAERVLQLDDDAPWVLDLLGALVDRSLVSRHPSGRRFDLLESVRVYAADKLQDPGPARLRHGQVFAALGSELANREVGHQLEAWDRLARELDNLVVACERAIDRGDGTIALETMKAATEVLDQRGPHSATQDLIDRVGALELSVTDRALLDLVAGRTLRRTGRTQDAVTRIEAARVVFHDHGMTRFEADALNHLGNLLRVTGDPDRALQVLDDAEALYESMGDMRSRAVVWGNRAAVHYVRGEMDAARSLYERALAVRRSMGDRRGEAHVLSSLAVVEQIQGQRGAAQRHYTASLRACRDLGDRRGEALALANLGVLAVDAGDFDLAERRWRQALLIRRAMGERTGVGILLGYLSTLAMERGQYDAGRDGAYEALEAHRQVGNRRLIGNMLGQLGAIALLEGEVDEARVHLQESRDLLAAVGERIGLGISLHWWARMLRLQGDTQGALEALDAANEVVGNRHLPTASLIWSWRAWALDAVGRKEEAIACIEQSIADLQRASVTRGLAELMTIRAWVYRDRSMLDGVLDLIPNEGSPSHRTYLEFEALLS